MPANADTVVRQMALLPSRSKDDMAIKLLKSVDEPSVEEIEMLWRAEIEERIQACDSGEMKTVPWETIWEKTLRRRKP